MGGGEGLGGLRRVGLTTGNGGGWAVIYGDGEVRADRLPRAESGALDLDPLLELIYRPCTKVRIEAPASTWDAAEHVRHGTLRGALDALGVPTRVVPARAWAGEVERVHRQYSPDVQFLRQHRLAEKCPEGVVAAIVLAEELR